MLLLFLTVLLFAGCGGGDRQGVPALNEPGPAVPQVEARPTALSVGSREVGELALAQLRTARATSGVYLLAPFTLTGAQAGPAGPFTIGLQPQAGGGVSLRVTDRSGGLRGVLVTQAPVTANGLTTVNAILGDGQQSFFGSTGTVVLTFDAQGLMQLRFRNLQATGIHPDLLPPPIGGFLTRDAEGNLSGRLSVPGNDENFQGKSFFEDPFGWFQETVLTPVGNFFGWSNGSEATVAPDFDTVGSTTDTRPSGDQLSVGYNVAPAGVASFTAGANVIGQNGGNVIGQNGANVIGQNGGNVIGQNGGNVIGQNGGNLISDHGAGVIGQNGANVIGQNGGNFRVYRTMAMPDADNDPPSTLELTFPGQNGMRLRLMSNLSPAPFAESLAVSTGTTIVYSVRAVDFQGNAIPYTSTRGSWGAASQSNSPVLYQDPNSPGRFIAVNPGNSLASFTDLDSELIATSDVAVSGNPVVIPGTILLTRQPETTQFTYQPLDPSPIARVVNTDGSSAAGVPVILEAVGPRAGFISQTVLTDSSGRAEFANFLLGVTGEHRLIARSGNLVFIGEPFQVETGSVLQSMTLQASGPTSLAVRDTVQLSAIGTLNDGTQLDVSSLVDWVSSSSGASVTSAGFVRGLAPGSATIQAIQKGGGSNPVTAQIAITVNAPPANNGNPPAPAPNDPTPPPPLPASWPSDDCWSTSIPTPDRPTESPSSTCLAAARWTSFRARPLPAARPTSTARGAPRAWATLSSRPPRVASTPSATTRPTGNS